ncbi:hypothetical protein [Amycolatopsis alkalitolerans]|uniref:GNAT family N-acetyltransferase n=1 Tax=Amycolatopsis alkalitolerans TaxID=2547244 RepID=A0A5C4LT62_9PSEU|nr:hypothetical protein [Amycolatopsis alkalitolerans]TNC22248.1 hypothetical protein FG385_26095 [Amycolatopsis alkalitolerans]
MCDDLPADPLSIQLRISREGLWWQIDGDPEQPERWAVTAVAETAAHEARHVADISLAIAAVRADHDLFDATVLGGWALDFLADAVADPRDGTLVQELEERISPGPPHLIVLRRIAIIESWRGHGLGAALLAGALCVFARYTRFAASHVSPTAFRAPGQDDLSAELAGLRVGRMLETIGFRRWRDVHILDLRNPSLLDVRNRLLDQWRNR